MYSWRELIEYLKTYYLIGLILKPLIVVVFFRVPLNNVYLLFSDPILVVVGYFLLFSALLVPVIDIPLIGILSFRKNKKPISAIIDSVFGGILIGIITLILSFLPLLLLFFAITVVYEILSKNLSNKYKSFTLIK